MKYMLLIHQGDTPTPARHEAGAACPRTSRTRIYADYQAINQTPGVTPGRLDGAAGDWRRRSASRTARR